MKIIVSQQGKKILIEFYCAKLKTHPRPPLSGREWERNPLDKGGTGGFGRLGGVYSIDKAEDFLMVVDRVVKLWQSRQRRLKRRGRPKFYYPVDKLIKKRKIRIESLNDANLEFIGSTPTPRPEASGVGAPTIASELTERVIRAIMLGLSFS